MNTREHRLHTYTAADDEDAAAGGAARAHLRLAAALVHARYSAILKASGANRAAEAEDWAEAARREWPGDGGAVAAAAEGVGSVGGGGAAAAVYDLQLMMPVTVRGSDVCSAD